MAAKVNADADTTASATSADGPAYFRATNVAVTDGLTHLSPGDVSPATDGLRACYARMGKDALEPATKADYDKFVEEGGEPRVDLPAEPEAIPVGEGAAVAVVGSSAEVEANAEINAAVEAEGKSEAL